MNKTSSKPAPEGTVRGKGGGTVDNTLEKLREKAARTGDMTEVVAYKRKLREKQAA